MLLRLLLLVGVMVVLLLPQLFVLQLLIVLLLLMLMLMLHLLPVLAVVLLLPLVVLQCAAVELLSLGGLKQGSAGRLYPSSHPGVLPSPARLGAGWRRCFAGMRRLAQAALVWWAAMER